MPWGSDDPQGCKALPRAAAVVWVQVTLRRLLKCGSKIPIQCRWRQRAREIGVEAFGDHAPQRPRKAEALRAAQEAYMGPRLRWGDGRGARWPCASGLRRVQGPSARLLEGWKVCHKASNRAVRVSAIEDTLPCCSLCARSSTPSRPRWAV